MIRIRRVGRRRSKSRRYNPTRARPRIRRRRRRNPTPIQRTITRSTKSGGRRFTPMSAREVELLTIVQAEKAARKIASAERKASKGKGKGKGRAKKPVYLSAATGKRLPKARKIGKRKQAQYMIDRGVMNILQRGRGEAGYRMAAAKRLTAQARFGGAPKRSHRRAIGSMYKRVKKLEGSLSGADRQLFNAMGLGAVPNRSMVGPLKGIVTMLPMIGVGIGSAVGVAYTGQKLGDMIRTSVPSAPKFVLDNAPAFGSGIITIAAYLLCRNVKALARFSGAVLIGGSMGTAIHVLASMKTKDAAGAEISLGKKLGLPIGEYTATGEYTSTGANDSYDRASRPGRGDDQADFVSGADDEPDFAPGQGPDGGDIGGIFDKPLF